MIFQSLQNSMPKGTPALKHCTAIFLWITLTSVITADEGREVICPDQTERSIRDQDEVWLLSCRGLDCVERGRSMAAVELTAGIATRRFDFTEKKWHDAELATLWNEEPPIKTVVWVHGNLTTASEAFSDGLTVYRQLVRGIENKSPLRFIIWSWPASKILTRPVPDARIKAARTTSAGFRLAGVLQRLPTLTDVSLIGFSFGARVVSATIELLAGGELNQTGLTSSTHSEQSSYRVTLFAAALDSTWLLPDHRFGKALNVVSHLTLINNYCDRVLKHYGKLYCHCAHRGPSALGYTGLPRGNLSDEERKSIEQFNASGSIGKQHAWRPYIESATTMELIRKGTLGSWYHDAELHQQVFVDSQ